MSRKGFSCPNCDSEYCSGILWWKPRVVHGTFDAYKCHDCQQLTEAGTRKKLPLTWQPPREVVMAQPDLFGNVKNVRETVRRVPKLVESPAGLAVAVMHVPGGATKQYRDEVMAMMREINKTSTGRALPHWYKYRNIKRGRSKKA